MSFTNQDIKQIKDKGLTTEKVTSQIALFKTGLPFAKLKAAATIGNGILKVSQTDQERFVEIFDAKKETVTLEKFVPASGAASRMFKFVFQFLEEFDPKTQSINDYAEKHNMIAQFKEGLKDFPFYEAVVSKIPSFDALSQADQVYAFANTMMSNEALDYGSDPKGVLPFHKYKDHIATAFEEHLLEASKYAASNGVATLHFTISEAHTSKFKTLLERVKKQVEAQTGVTFKVSFSYQKPSTDTIAVNTDNTPFRQDDGSILFRPGGHGALVENLNELGSAVVFIKNIDNVVVNTLVNEVSDSKKMLAGVLLEAQESTFAAVKKLEGETLSTTDLEAIAAFATTQINIVLPTAYASFSNEEKQAFLLKALDKPMRVCGMVKNEGEPGGGPFWVEDTAQKVSLQIVESAQINTADAQQKEILQNSTHFNPVDLVCGLKNHRGEAYNLLDYVDGQTAFITSKTKAGKELKALELPGLWNGAMAHWNTIFVEVPLVTFNPVKTVNDLLKPRHQGHA